jgi:hypothetical protein
VLKLSRLLNPAGVLEKLHMTHGAVRQVLLDKSDEVVRAKVVL